MFFPTSVVKLVFGNHFLPNYSVLYLFRQVLLLLLSLSLLSQITQRSVFVDRIVGFTVERKGHLCVFLLFSNLHAIIEL